MLGTRQQIFHRDLTMVSQAPAECGGILSYVTSSGVEVLDYVADPTDASPLGVLLHNVEVMDEGYMWNPWKDRGVRRVSKPGESVAFSCHCEIDTNFVHPNAAPHSGKKAYLGPSGLVTDDASLGGPQIGRFMSNLNDRNVPGLPNGGQSYVLVRGGGFVRGQYMKKVAPGKFEIQEESIETAKVLTPGWVRIRIKI